MTGHRLDAAQCDSVAIDAGGLRVTPAMSLVLPPEAVESGDADMIIDGNLGMPFLRRWLVTLDLASGNAWIAPGIGPAASAPESALPPKPTK